MCTNKKKMGNKVWPDTSTREKRHACRSGWMIGQEEYMVEKSNRSKMRRVKIFQESLFLAPTRHLGSHPAKIKYLSINILNQNGQLTVSKSLRHSPIILTASFISSSEMTSGGAKRTLKKQKQKKDQSEIEKQQKVKRKQTC